MPWFPGGNLEASCLPLWVPSWHWSYSCPPKHHNKSLLFQTSSCFSFAALTKISHGGRKAYCASLTYQAHILASRKDLRLSLRLAPGILVLVEGCASLSLSSTWTAVIAYSHRWAKHCFILSGKDLKQWLDSTKKKDLSLFLCFTKELIWIFSSSVMVTGFIWLFPSAGHSSKCNRVISLFCTLHNQSNSGGPGTRLCARGDGVNGLCIPVDVVWHSWESVWERWGVPQAKSPVSLWEWYSSVLFCCCTEHQRILVVVVAVLLTVF